MPGLLGAFMLSVAFSTPAPPADAPCTRVARDGQDLARFVNGLRPGAVACLRDGDYGGPGVFTQFAASGTARRPIALRGYPGDQPPRIRGFTSFEGDHLRLSGLRFPGGNGRIEGKRALPVSITGDDVELRDSEVRDSRAQGVYLDGAYRARVLDNVIEDNGDFGDPATANLDHGIYFASGSGLIRGNRIRGNRAYGIQLYPSASGVLVQGNRISGQGRGGVIVSGVPGRPPPAGNRITGNVITANARRAVTSFGVLGPGNVVVGNRERDNEASGSTAGLVFGAGRTPALIR